MYIHIQGVNTPPDIVSLNSFKRKQFFLVSIFDLVRRFVIIDIHFIFRKIIVIT